MAAADGTSADSSATSGGESATADTSGGEAVADASSGDTNTTEYSNNSESTDNSANSNDTGNAPAPAPVQAAPTQPADNGCASTYHPAVTHQETVNHPAVTHQETVTVVDDYGHLVVICSGCGAMFDSVAAWEAHRDSFGYPGFLNHSSWHDGNSPEVSHQEVKTVVDQAAYSETVTVTDRAAYTGC